MMKRQSPLTVLTIVWLVLCAATIGSAGLSYSAGLTTGSRAAGISILAIAFGKAHLVLEHFMELKHAPVVWRGVFVVWIVVTFLGLAGLYATMPTRGGW